MNEKSPIKKKHMFDVRSPKERPNIRSTTIRKSAKDGTTWTPTEKRRRDKAMRQFSNRNKGYAVAISNEYRDGYDEIDWSNGATEDDLKNCGGKK